jgi:AraC family transcriptional regulator
MPAIYLRIEILTPKKLIGKHHTMSFSQDTTADLWRSFMPLRNTIKNRVNADFISLQFYPFDLVKGDFKETTPFEKWAVVEVSDFDHVPAGLETLVISGGLYAVFLHQGLASDFAKTADFIFAHWLPQSAYALDQRPHFEVLGEKYKNNDPASEEEVWIPIRPKEEDN